MSQIARQTKQELGINEQKFYVWRGINPPEFLNFIDKINAVLDLPALEEDQVLLIAQFIKYEFCTLTMAEVQDAIFKAKAGKLECNSSDYNKLSIDFLGRILKAYTEYKAKKHLVNKLETNKVKELTYTPDEGKSSYEFIKDVYEKDSKEPIIANWGIAFKYMELEGMIVMDNEEKAMIKDMLIYEINQEIAELRKNRKNYKHLAESLNKPDLIKYECRKKMVKTHFEAKL